MKLKWENAMCKERNVIELKNRNWSLDGWKVSPYLMTCGVSASFKYLAEKLIKKSGLDP